jgi:uncharacterized protein (DUF1697 family)
MPHYVALLRGINVGGKNKLSMADLASIFVDAGVTNVRTYIQSGNVLFEASSKAASGVPRAVATTIGARFGYRVPVVLRSASELRSALEGNPFLARGLPADELLLAFLADAPSTARVAALDPTRGAPDAFEVRGREIYLHLPNGLGRSKLTNDYFDRALGTTSTVRNWRTVEALAALVA